MVLVSVLMRSYNHEDYISEAIDSVLNQSCKDLELIIVDDFSKDSSKTIIKKYENENKRIKAFFHDTNMGMASTMNDLFSKASGKYIAYIDSDDSWFPLKIEKQLAILEKNDSLVVWSEGEIIDQNSTPTGETFTQINLATEKKKSGEIFEDLLHANFIFLSSLIHNRIFAKDILFDQKLKYLNDYKFVVALANKHNFLFIKEPLVKYRMHGKNSNMHSNKEAWHQDVVIINEHFLKEYQKEIPKRTKAIIYFYLFWSYYVLNEKALSKFFFLKALKSNWILYQIVLTLTNTKKRLSLLRYFFIDQLKAKQGFRGLS
jgi:glycosyltransferase involved in cell wall biosynthesis